MLERPSGASKQALDSTRVFIYPNKVNNGGQLPTLHHSKSLIFHCTRPVAGQRHQYLERLYDNTRSLDFI